MEAAAHGQHLTGRVASLAPLFAVLLSIGPTAPSVAGDDPLRTESVVTIEAETYTWSFDNCGETICVATCDSTSSGGKAADGLDCPGDFIQWDLYLPEPMVFRDSLRSAGDVGLRRQYVIQFLPSGGHGPMAAVDTLTTGPGRGLT
jgi:hypothetical protein